jgi:hypothetical protein
MRALSLLIVGLAACGGGGGSSKLDGGPGDPDAGSDASPGVASFAHLDDEHIELPHGTGFLGLYESFSLYALTASTDPALECGASATCVTLSLLVPADITPGTHTCNEAGVQAHVDHVGYWTADGNTIGSSCTFTVDELGPVGGRLRVSALSGVFMDFEGLASLTLADGAINVERGADQSN